MTDRDLVEPLRSAIARADAAWTTQPSHLRRRLEEELGSEARRHRAQVHQLVVAAEERVPMRLQRGGWSTDQRDELVGLLVSTRGWTATASEWAVATWAAALGMSDDRPAVPTSPRRSDSTRSQPSPPLALGSDPTSAPSDVGQFGPTDLPGGQGSEPTELPVAPTPSLSPTPTTAPPMPSRTSSTDLPTRSTKKCTRTTSAFLDGDLDVAYDVKAGPTPALLLLAVPVGLAAFVLPALSGVLLMAFLLIVLVGRVAWPSRILAIRGDQVWLLASRGPAAKPTAVLAEGTRDEVEFAGGRPFPSVRFAGQRVWFQYPITLAARRIPTTGSEAA